MGWVGSSKRVKRQLPSLVPVSANGPRQHHLSGCMASRSFWEL